MLIDCHSHIHVKDFDRDRDEVIKRATVAGVLKMIEIGFDSEGIFKVVALANKYEFIYAVIGVHPHLASEWDEMIAAKIEKLVKMEEKVVAIGEIGLDYYKNFQPRDLQQKVFREQLKLAKKLDMPVVIHCRDAYVDLFNIMDEEKVERALLHCFTGTEQEAEEGLKRGYYIAFTGVITYPSASALREVAKNAPLDKILIETDCPFLSPKSRRGQRNEPSFIGETYKEVAKLKKMSEDDLEEAITQNAHTFFRL
ncbi:MAG: TatD family hydrolase [Patescibacteria group bacterium]